MGYMNIQRIAKSGIRLYSYTWRGNLSESPINRLRSSANSRRWMCSSSSRSCGDAHSSVKRTFNIDSSAMVKALEAQGIPRPREITTSMIEFLDELEKGDSKPYGLLRDKFDALKLSIKEDDIRLWFTFWSAFFLGIIGMGTLCEMLRQTDRHQPAQPAPVQNRRQ